jgi:hypothetical protein
MSRSPPQVRSLGRTEQRKRRGETFSMNVIGQKRRD